MEKIVHKVAFTSKKCISIAYSENKDDKVLESDEAISEKFCDALAALRNAVQDLMGWDVQQMRVISADKIVFATEKKAASITFRASFSDGLQLQYFGCGMSLRKLYDEDFPIVAGKPTPSDYARVTGCIDEIRNCCENYLDGERAEPEPELDFGPQ